MTRTVLLALACLLCGSSIGSAENHAMKKAEFQLFLHDLERDTNRWIEVVAEIDPAILKKLPYEKGHLMEMSKKNLNDSLASVLQDVSDLRTGTTLSVQVELLMDLEETKAGMDDLEGNIDVEEDADMDKFTKWKADAMRSFKEVQDTSLKFYEHLLATTARLDNKPACQLR
jgi:hypothetical protein